MLLEQERQQLVRGRFWQRFVLILPGLNPGGEQSEQVDVLAVVRAGHAVADVVQERVCGLVLGGCGDIGSRYPPAMVLNASQRSRMTFVLAGVVVFMVSLNCERSACRIWKPRLLEPSTQQVCQPRVSTEWLHGHVLQVLEHSWQVRV
jgi:hypothetical protein